MERTERFCSNAAGVVILVVAIVQRLSGVQLSVTPRTAALQAFLSITMSSSLLKLMSIESVMLSNHFILCHLLILLPSIFPSIRVFSNESVLRVRWPKYPVLLHCPRYFDLTALLSQERPPWTMEETFSVNSYPCSHLHFQPPCSQWGHMILANGKSWIFSVISSLVAIAEVMN